jgi:hypothetical protein
MKLPLKIILTLCILGASISEFILFFNAKTNDQVMVSITLFLIFISVGTFLLVIEDKRKNINLKK